MKQILLIGWFSFFALIGIAQVLSGNNNSGNPTSFAAALALFDDHYSAGKYPEAQKYALMAKQMADDDKDKQKQAIALNRQAKVLLRLIGDIDNNRNVAEKKLRESIAIYPDKQLHLENLLLLKEIAYARGKSREKKKIDEEIAVLTGEQTADEQGGLNGLFGKKRREAEEKAAALAEEKAAMSAQKEILAREKQTLAETVNSLEDKQEKLKAQKENLAQSLALKETAIREMNEAQIRAEFMLLEQKRLVDSMSYMSELDSIRLLNEEMEKSRYRVALTLEKVRSNFLLALIGTVFIILIGLLMRFMGIRKHNRVLEEKNKIIEEEKKRSEDLLLNILPKIVADELKLNGTANAKRFDNATVLFTDFKDFTSISKQMSPEKLVKDLDYCFKAFDTIIEKYGLEKIKTIGDAYMCAGGVPTGNTSQAKDVINAALEIQQFLKEWKAERIAQNQPYFEARIGIHTGPIVAGVVGNKKFAYDIWGSTVNVASRMETGGEVGKVNISSATYNYVKNDFEFEHRGKVNAKNYGDINMYFVKG